MRHPSDGGAEPGLDGCGGQCAGRCHDHHPAEEQNEGGHREQWSPERGPQRTAHQPGGRRRVQRRRPDLGDERDAEQENAPGRDGQAGLDACSSATRMDQHGTREAARGEYQQHPRQDLGQVGVTHRSGDRATLPADRRQGHGQVGRDGVSGLRRDHGQQGSHDGPQVREAEHDLVRARLRQGGVGLSGCHPEDRPGGRAGHHRSGDLGDEGLDRDEVGPVRHCRVRDLVADGAGDRWVLPELVDVGDEAGLVEHLPLKQQGDPTERNQDGGGGEQPVGEATTHEVSLVRREGLTPRVVDHGRCTAPDPVGGARTRRQDLGPWLAGPVARKDRSRCCRPPRGST